MEGENHTVVLMGVSGCGKSHIGTSLAQKLGLEFIEGDDYHSAENKEKMAQGIPLNDEDRLSWLVKLRNLLQEASNSLVVSCSALKKSYIRRYEANLCSFVHFTRSYRTETQGSKGSFFQSWTFIQSVRNIRTT